MPSFADIHARVATLLINPASAVSAEIPRIVFDCYRRIESLYPWRALEGEWSCYAVPGHNATRIPLTDRAFLRLRDDKERPYVVEREIDDERTDGVNAQITTDNPTAGNDALNVNVNYAVGATLGFTVGGIVLIETETAGAIGWATRAGIILSGQETLGFVTQLRVSVDDASMATGTTAHPAGDRLWTLGAEIEKHPLEWIHEPDVRRWYNPTQVAQRPSHVRIASQAESGEPAVEVFPKPDQPYEIRVPCLLSLLPSLHEIPDEATSNWLTSNAFELLAHMAAAEAFRSYSWDDSGRDKKLDEVAQRSLMLLMATEAHAKVTSQTLRVGGGPRGPISERIARW